MLAKICQWLWELLRAQGSCIFLPLTPLAQRSLFSLLETGASALHQALLRAARSSSLTVLNRADCVFLWLFQIKFGLWSWNLYLFHYWFYRAFYQKAEIVGHTTLKKVLRIKKQFLINYQFWKLFFVVVYVLNLLMTSTVRSISTEFSYATNLRIKQAIMTLWSAIMET